jgi:hypothetical protein
MPPGGQATIPEDFFGVVHAAKTLTPQEDIIIDEIGCKWILRTLNWELIEPEKDVFDFSYYDIYVDHAKKQGLKIIGLLGYSTYYLNNNLKKYISPENMPSFLHYVEETVRHYKGKVDVWNIWNEPNITFWKGKNSEFYELTKLAAEKIREIDPDAYIIGGIFWRSPTNFIKKMHAADGFKDLDAVAFHPYAANPSDCMDVYDKFKRILSELNYSSPIWITEVGYPTAGWYPTKVFQKKYPIFIAKTLTGLAARGARALLWFEMIDNIDANDKSLNSEDYFGLIKRDFTRKAGSWAFELCARYLPGSRYVPELPQRENVPSNIVSFCFLDGISGNNALVIWNDKRHIQKFEFDLPSTALVHDISTGLNTPLPADKSLGIGNKPLIITWQGTDIPRISKKR